MKKIEVVAAVICREGKVLVVQRGSSKLDYISEKWEFPGGKMEAGETQEDTIRREILEELLMDIFVKDKLITVEHTYPDFHLTMHTYFCESHTLSPFLNEHIDFKWLTIEELDIQDWAAADLPIVNALKKL